ncbi:MAG TPA: hypothetical protein VGK59_18020, partial [Ohtaekwangia sp.]
MVGNDFGNEVFAGRQDAHTGIILLGDGKNNFSVSNAAQSNFYVPGDAKSLVRLSGSKRDLFIASRNQETLRVFSRVSADNRDSFIPLPFDTYAELQFSDGKKQKIEFYYGSGYLSQSSRIIRIPMGVKEMVIFNSKGESRKFSPTGK